MKIPVEPGISGNGSGDIMDDDITRTALDSFFMSEAQTYDDFVANFTQLTADDLHVSANTQRRNVSQPTVNPDDSRSLNLPKIESIDRPEVTSGDGLEEQTLEAGLRVASVLNSLNLGAHLHVQLDNYVMADLSDDDDDDDDDVSGSEWTGYVASSAMSPSPSTAEDLVPTTNRTGPDPGVCPLNPGATWPLNPGEVEIVDPGVRIECVTKIRVPGGNYRIKTLEECARDAQQEAEAPPCSDEVVPFALDEHFDYDNVSLTPKFTEAEIAYLKSCATASTAGAPES